MQPGFFGETMGHPYDIIVVGGGLAGAAFARAMARRDARVLVVEREMQFKDRVRGEVLTPWGVAELRRLGLYEIMRDTCAREMPWFDTYLGSVQISHRDLPFTTSVGLPAMNWVHCEMEEVLLNAAAEAGAEVRRGAEVTQVQLGAKPSVCVKDASGIGDFTARLVVAADGRSSNVRKWADFRLSRDDFGLLVAGVLLDMPAIDHDVNAFVLNPENGTGAFVAPQSGRRARAYVAIPRDRSYRLQGLSDLARFVQDSVAAGAPEKWYSDIRPIGPLATFDGADNWVEHPYRSGIALIGDAASASDPTYGQGQALSLRYARILSEHLTASGDWNAAAQAYAEAHDLYYSALHRFTRWFWELFLEPGSKAAARRARALPLIGEDPTRMPDVLYSGPDLSMDESVRRRFFGEG